MENKESFLSIDVWDDRQTKQRFLAELVTNNYDNVYIFAQNEWEYYKIFDEFVPPLLEYFLKTSGRNVDVITSVVSPSPHGPSYQGYNVHCWDTYWMYKTYAMLKLHKYVNERQVQRQKNTEIKYHYVMMNNRTHKFRCQLIDKVAEKGILDKGAVSWNNTDSFLMQGYEFKHFDGKVRILDEKYLTPQGGQYSMPDQYFQSFAQIVSESNPDILFFSEKISTALLLGKPFLAAQSMGIHAYLRDTLGFQLYDEIFDYSFDKIPQMNVRWALIAENFKNLCEYSIADLKELNKKIKDKVIFNQQRVSQIVRDTTFMPDPIKKCLDLFNNEGKLINTKLAHLFMQVRDADELDFI